MKKLLINIAFFTFVLNLIVSSNAYALSSLANDLIRECNKCDEEFPPANWNMEQLRSAGLEILNAIESGSVERSNLYCCLYALGYVKNPNDIDRILKYEKDMPTTVLHTLDGFPHEKAIKCMLRFTISKDEILRELAYIGLGNVDYTKLEKDSKKWREKAKNMLIEKRRIEKKDWILESLDKALKKIDSNATGTSTK